jgi:hypothetical protein
MITWTLNHLGRLTDRVRTGTWCQHTDRWGPWHMVDLGREKIRYCERCGWMETTNHPWRGLFRRH